MDRRQFLKTTMMVTAGIELAPLLRILPVARAESVPLSTLAVTEGTDYTVLASRVIDALGGISLFVKPGSKVVVKPNIGWDRNPDQAATTHPDIVSSIVKMALSAGAAQVLVFDYTCNEERRCYVNSGIQKAVEAIGDERVKCQFIDDRKFVSMAIEKGKSITKWDFYKDAIDADCYINVPIAKHHGISKLTLGMKNAMGVIGGNRGQIHFSIGQRLADLNYVLRPELTIIDATRILLRNGPQGGNLTDVKVSNTLIASRDIVAADAYATTLFGMKPEAIDSTVAGFQMGLGEMDLTKIKTIRA